MNEAMNDLLHLSAKSNRAFKDKDSKMLPQLSSVENDPRDLAGRRETFVDSGCLSCISEANLM